MPELLSVAEAAKVLDIPERTFRRWVASGRVNSEPDPLGARGRVVAAEVVMQLREALNGTGQRPANDRPTAETDRPPPATDRPPPANDRPLAAAWDRERDLLLDDRRRQDEEISHLRAQLDVRSQEIAHRDQAESELRRLLLTAQQLAHELAQQLEQKMLPPHIETPPETPNRRVRWWTLWRR